MLETSLHRAKPVCSEHQGAGGGTGLAQPLPAPQPTGPGARPSGHRGTLTEDAVQAVLRTEGEDPGTRPEHSASHPKGSREKYRLLCFVSLQR